MPLKCDAATVFGNASRDCRMLPKRGESLCWTHGGTGSDGLTKQERANQYQEAKHAEAGESISDIKLDPRAKNILLRAHLQIVSDVASMSDYELLKLRNLGNRGLYAIRRVIPQVSTNEHLPKKAGTNEYQVIICKSNDYTRFTTTLNEFSAEGWEVVPGTVSLGSYPRALLVRMIQ